MNRAKTTPNERKLTAALGELLACIEVDDLDAPASERTYRLEGFVADAVRRANIAYGAAVRRAHRAEAPAYKVCAIRLIGDGRLENVSSHETLGHVHGRTYATERAAARVAVDLESGKSEIPGHKDLMYTVEAQ